MPKYSSKYPPKPQRPDRGGQHEHSRGRRDAHDPDALLPNARVHGESRQERGRPSFRLPAEEQRTRYPGRGRGHTPEQSFKCGHCKRFIGPLPSGGSQRNHCPYCLYSRHVDDRRPGDRASACASLMEPIGAFQRPNGEHCIVHHCLGCGFERFNRIGADDDFDLVLSLPVVPSRSARSTASDVS